MPYVYCVYRVPYSSSYTLAMGLLNIYSLVQQLDTFMYTFYGRPDTPTANVITGCNKTKLNPAH